MIPKNIIKIIKSYINEDEYKKSITSDKQLLLELRDIEKDYTLNFILAHKLTKNFIINYKNNIKYIKNKDLVISLGHDFDINILSGVFVALLHIYTYDELIDAKNITDNYEFGRYEEKTQNLLEYILYLYKYIYGLY